MSGPKTKSADRLAKVAGKIGAELFELGANLTSESPCHRISFKGRNKKSNEIDMGGLCQLSFEYWLTQMLIKYEKQIKGTK